MTKSFRDNHMHVYRLVYEEISTSGMPEIHFFIPGFSGLDDGVISHHLTIVH